MVNPPAADIRYEQPLQEFKVKDESIKMKILIVFINLNDTTTEHDIVSRILKFTQKSM